MKCQNCKEDFKKEDLYKFAGTKACLDCWKEYFMDNELFIDESWNDFVEYTLKCLKDEQGVKHENK